MDDLGRALNEQTGDNWAIFRVVWASTRLLGSVGRPISRHLGGSGAHDTHELVPHGDFHKISLITTLYNHGRGYQETYLPGRGLWVIKNAHGLDQWSTLHMVDALVYHLLK